jgi:hypothetical protein
MFYILKRSIRIVSGSNPPSGRIEAEFSKSRSCRTDPSGGDEEIRRTRRQNFEHPRTSQKRKNKIRYWLNLQLKAVVLKPRVATLLGGHQGSIL